MAQLQVYYNIYLYIMEYLCVSNTLIHYLLDCKTTLNLLQGFDYVKDSVRVVTGCTN